jgi:hypothetical protein
MDQGIHYLEVKARAPVLLGVGRFMGGVAVLFDETATSGIRVESA